MRPQDIEWAKSICERYHIDYDCLYRAGFCFTDISDIAVACYHGLKKYHFWGCDVESSYIQVEDHVQIHDQISDMCGLLRQHVIDCDLAVFVFLVHDMGILKTFAYYIHENGYSVCEYDRYMSRGGFIIPKLEKELMNYMKCRVFIGSSSQELIDDTYLNEALELSKVLAENNCELAFGACSSGMMGACYQGFHLSGQSVYSCTVDRYRDDLLCLDSETEMIFDDTFMRTKQLYTQADVVVLLPGGTGTLAEFFSMLEEKRTTVNPKQIVLYNFNGFYDKVLLLIQGLVDQKFNDESIFDYFVVASTRDEVISLVRNNIYQKKKTKK